MPYEPQIFSYDELRHHAEEFLAEDHPESSIPVPIEEIVELDFKMEIIPVPGLKDEIGVDALLTLPSSWASCSRISFRRAIFSFWTVVIFSPVLSQ